MMNLKQYLLLLINEESNELAKEAGKAIRFGINERAPQDKRTNEERMSEKFINLVATLYIANYANINMCPTYINMAINEYKELIIDKIKKIFKFMRVSVFEGQLNLTTVEISKLEDAVNNSIISLLEGHEINDRC